MIKNTKVFFDENLNKLNKGYLDHANDKNNRTLLTKYKNFENLLPPVDVMEYYESYYPGATKKLIEILETGQKNQHDIAMKYAQVQLFSNITSSTVFVVFSFIVCLTSFFMLPVLHEKVVFFTLACFLPYIIKYCLSYKNEKKKQFNSEFKNFHNKHTNNIKSFKDYKHGR